jgi:succinate-semialdehyde dehydrogenase / glutarate-semialdehyde dehydrogenase
MHRADGPKCACEFLSERSSSEFMALASINPATGNTLESFQPHTATQIDERLQRADAAFVLWRGTPFRERAAKMLRLAEILEAERERFARLMAMEMGKLLRAGMDEAAKCALGARFYAAHAEAFLSDEPVAVEEAQAFVRYQPLGPILAIMPWNFPFWQVIRFAAPALMAGNVGLLKHASNVPQCALALEDLFRRAGFPEHTFQTLLIGSEAVDRLIEDPRVAAVTLTGSEDAGRHVAATAGRVIKKTVLELGGSDPFIVLPSANLEEAVKTAVKARIVNAGQSCIAAKRFIVHERIYPEFERQFVTAMSALVVGDPLDPQTELGPLATAEILSALDDQVRRSVQAGARLLAGGARLERPGNFYPPTVLAEIPESAPVFHEEVFGPVALLFSVRSLEKAIRLANATAYGLGSSAWTNERSEQARLIDEVVAGQVFINAIVASDPRLPFGGVKRSGYGRELGCAGIREFVNAKTVWIGRSPLREKS